MANFVAACAREGAFCSFSNAMACYTAFEFRLPSVIRGHHVYKFIWSPVIGEILQLEIDAENAHDAHAVGIVNNTDVVATARWKYNR